MQPTISDVYRKFESSGLKLLTGTKGLSNPVTTCGILDYEFDEELIAKYSHTNFLKDQLILSSFLYAKDNEYLILKAIKNLRERGCSGLIIRNVFHISIKKNMIRYADSMGFPIFFLTGSALYFEEIIIAVHELNKNYKSFYYCEEKVDFLLAHSADSPEYFNAILDMNPSFESDVITMYFKGKQTFSMDDYMEAEALFKDCHMMKNSDSFFYYKNGFMIICTRHMFQENAVQARITPFLEALSDKCQDFHIGVSSIYHSITDLRSSIMESLYSASFHSETDKEYLSYQDLGVYQVIVPYINDSVMKGFLKQYLSPLQDYDAENQGSLFETALEYVKNHGSIASTAASLGQHKNTVRNRLNRISEVLGCNIIATEHYEKLMLAVKIYTCQKLSSDKPLWSF